MPLLDARHDLAHPVETDQAWSESYYFNAYDPPSDTGLFTRIGIRPNEGTMDVGLSIWLPGDELAEYRVVVEQRTMVDRDLAVGQVRYRMLEPMASWRLTMEGQADVRRCSSPPGGAPERQAEIALDVTFESVSPAVGVDSTGTPATGAAAAAAGSVGKGHLEQAGRWKGTLEIDGRTHSWSEARGNRDRSWGPRRWGGPRMWRWFSINVGDDTAFGGIRIGTAEGDLHRGWVWDGERVTSIRHWDVRSELGPDGLTQRRAEVVAEDKSGRRHVLHAELLRVAAIGTASPARGGTRTVVNEGLARWDYQGRTGYGIAEYLHQLDDQGRPVVAVA